MFRNAVALIKYIALFFFIFMFLFSGLITSMVIWGKWRKKRYLTQVISFYCRIGLWILNVKIIEDGPAAPEGGVLIVSNHQTYLDILVQSSTHSTCFVTSKEIKETPLLGQICTMAGCLFVERRSRENLHKEIREITEALEHDLHVTIFPEATSTNGESIIRFRRPLYTGAIDSDRPVMPKMIRYMELVEPHGTVPVTKANRDKVCWYGDMDFVPHLWTMAKLKGLTVKLVNFPMIDTKGRESTELALETYNIINEAYQPYQ